ncbi:MAG TPA: site-specific integrase [Gemmatimonadaceae bacterium]|nr:site-specific integrase [Gemmatimonadaceae bacterium]
MSVYRRPETKHYAIELRWRGYPRIRLSACTASKTRARQIEATLVRLRDAGRRDLIELLVAGKLNLRDVHNRYLRDPASIEQVMTRQETPALGPLVDQWVEWLRDPATISPRTRRSYAPRSVDRYVEGWAELFKVLSQGRETPLGELTRGAMLEYRTARRRAGCSGSTLNRDLSGVQSFLRWAEDEAGFAVPHFRMPKEREPEGRERWLDAGEVAALETATGPDWWPLFASLIYTGLRIGEALGLEWADVRLSERRIRVHEKGGRRLKTASSQRDVPIAAPLAAVLEQHRTRVRSGPADAVFPSPYGDYWRALHRFQRCVRGAKIAPATIHDLRHTFGVHCAQAGVPLPRLQKLMGHASPVMTMRYMKHAPESYFAEDAARLAASLQGATRPQESPASTGQGSPSLRLA